MTKLGYEKMKKCLIVLLGICSMFTACNMGGGKQTGPTHYPFKESENDLWGLVDANGKVLVENEFKERPSLVFDGMFFVENNGKYELYSINNPTNPIGEKYKAIAYFHEGLAPSVKENEGIKYIDNKGDVRFELPEEYVYAKRFENGYSLIAKIDEHGDYFWDAVAKNGNILKFADYSLVASLKNGTFLAKVGNSQTYCIIDKNGNKKAELEDMSHHVENNVDAVLSPDNKNYIFSDVKEVSEYLFINGNDGVKSVNGEVLIKGKEHVDLEFLDNGLVKFFNNEDKEYGIMDVRGNVIIRPKYKSIVAFGKNRYIVSKESDNGWLYGLIDQKENRILGFDYKDLDVLSNRTLITRKSDFDFIMGEKWIRQIITIKGEVLGEYQELWSVDYPDFSIVKSDRFDVVGCIMSLLYSQVFYKSIDELYGYAGLKPNDCANALKEDITIDDIIEDIWIPGKFSYTIDYGTVSYYLGFSNGVVDTYYDEDDYWQLYPRYTFANHACDCIRVRLQMNDETRTHKDLIEKQIGDILLRQGYSKSGTSRYGGNPLFCNSKVTIEVKIDYDLVLEAHIK